jgi:hypothetical protein
MIATTARTGGAVGVALSATLFNYFLSASGLSSSQIDSPEGWQASPDIFAGSFNYTVHIVNLFSLLALFFSALRGSRPNELLTR